MQNPLDTLRQKPESGDRRAVSPVIGVILMVAITVILAAVIATFVLGLGEQVSDTTPNANFEAEFNNTADGDPFVTIQHQAGDDIETQNLNVTVQGTEFELNSSTIGGSEQFSAGDSFTIGFDSGNINVSSSGGSISSVADGDEIELVFNSGQGTGSILRTFEVPEAYNNN